MREREWEVFYDSACSPIKVMATSAADAVEQVEQKVEAEKYYPHRTGCGCRSYRRRCFIADTESKLRGTPLGRLCRL